MSRKLKKRKKIISLQALTALLGISIEAEQYRIEHDNSKEENKNGYETVKIIGNTEVGQRDFVILHINKTSKLSTSLLCEKIEKCNEIDSSVGLILDVKEVSLNELYKKIDCAQEVLRKYNKSKTKVIDFPIYLNIDGLLGKTADVKTQQEIIKSFIDKTTKSGMCIGFYGKDSNLCKLSEQVSIIKNYDAFLVQDSKKINYKGQKSIVKNLDNKIEAYTDISKSIYNENLNNSNRLAKSMVYKVKKNDTFESISKEYNISEKDLRQYNNCSEKSLKEGKIIYIPSHYEIHTVNGTIHNYPISSGIDISDNQNKLSWDTIKKTSDFVIVEVARDNNSNHQGSSIIETAPNQIKKVIENNIDLGLYFYVYQKVDILKYEEKLNVYFEKLQKCLKKDNVRLSKNNVPVFLDFEVYDKSNDYYEIMSKFEKVCNKNGFRKVGIYGNRNTLNAISQQIKETHNVIMKDTDWIVWLSGGNKYSSRERSGLDKVKISEIEEDVNYSNEYFITSIEQKTNVCVDSGAANYLGYCDYNLCYSNIFESEESTRVDDFTPQTIKNFHLTSAAIGVFQLGFTISCIGVGIKAYYEQKNHNKTKKLVYSIFDNK